MNRIAAYWIALGACVFALGSYSVSPTLRSYLHTSSRPAPGISDKAVSLAVLANVSADVSAPAQALAPQNTPAEIAPAENISVDTASNQTINDSPQPVVLPPQRETSAAPAMAPAQVIPLPTVTPTPQPVPLIEHSIEAKNSEHNPVLAESLPPEQKIEQSPVVEQNTAEPQTALVAPNPAIEDPVIERSEPAPAAPANTLPGGCWVETPPTSLGLDPYYVKYCSAYGIPIVTSIAVPDTALQRAWEIVTYMLDGLPQGEDIRASITSRATRIGIIGQNQVTTDLPEHRALYGLFPNVDWNNRARGVGATPEIPLLSVAEENLLCYSGDLWVGQNVLVHEFAHTIKNLGLDFVNPNFHVELERIYQQARDAGLWPDTYVISDVEEYWAEGVRLYFQIDQGGAPGGQVYPADSRAELQTYDPELYRIVESIFGPRGGIALCP